MERENTNSIFTEHEWRQNDKQLAFFMSSSTYLVSHNLDLSFTQTVIASSTATGCTDKRQSLTYSHIYYMYFYCYANNSDPRFYYVSLPQLQIPHFLLKHFASFPLNPLFVMNPGSKCKQRCGFLRGRVKVFQGSVQGKQLRCQSNHLSLLVQILSESWGGSENTWGWWECSICEDVGFF